MHVCVPETGVCEEDTFYIVPGGPATLIGRRLSESLGVLRVGVGVSNSVNVS